MRGAPVLVSLALCFALAACGAQAPAPEPSPSESPAAWEMYDVTDYDVDTHFANYAEPGATVTLDAPEDGQGANIVGVVRSRETNEKLHGATVRVGGVEVTTGSDGRFQIRNLPAGKHDFTVSAGGFYDAEYLNYEAYPQSAAGATVFCFEISAAGSITDDFEA